MAGEAKGEVGRNKQVRRILDAAVQGGLIDADMSIRDVMGRFGPSIDEVAGYVLAWEKYVLVVAAAREDLVSQFDQAR